MEVAAAEAEPEAAPLPLAPEGLALEDELGGLMALPLTPIRPGKTPFPPGPV